MERPLALSLVTAWLTDLWDVAIPLGITLELLWLDVIAMGSVIQPFGGMAYLLLFPLCATLSWTQPGVLLLPLVLSMLAAHVGALCELRYRVRQNVLLDRVGGLLEHNDPALPLPTPEALVARSLVGRIVWHALLYLSCYAILCLVVASLLEAGLYPVLPSLEWGFVYALAIIGAVLSLRERRAYIICGISMAAIVALVVGGHFLAAA